MRDVVDVDSTVESMRGVIQLLAKLQRSQQQFVLKSVAELLGLSDVVPSGQGGAERTGLAPPSEGATVQSAGTVKDFIVLKMPETDVERIVCLAFFLSSVDRRSTFATLDLSKANQQARLPPLSNTAYAVSRAVKAGMLTKQRDGALQLSALGEAFVNALPDRKTAISSLKNSPLRGRRSARGKGFSARTSQRR